MEKQLRAKELALEGATIAFFVVALAGMLAGAEGYIAVLRAVGAGVAVVFFGRFPAHVLLTALEPAPPQEPGEQEAMADAPAQPMPGAQPASPRAA